MADWFAVVSGRENVLAELSDKLRLPGTVLEKVAGEYWLRDTDFEAFGTDQHQQVMAVAQEIVSYISSAAFLDEDLTANVEVIRVGHIREDGTKVNFVSIQCTGRARCTISAVPLDETGKPLEAVPGPAPSMSAKIGLAKRDPQVAKVFRLLQKPLNWGNLRRLHEIIDRDLTATGTVTKPKKETWSVALLGWTDHDTIQRLQWCASDPNVSGDEAVHGAMAPRVHPLVPMDLLEARTLVEALVRRWLETKLPTR